MRMLSEKTKSLFKKIGMEYEPVAIKFCFSEPTNIKRISKTLSLCEFAKEAQRSGQQFYISKDNEDCVGKNILGMSPIPAFGASGAAGVDFGVFRTQGANARLYHSLTVLHPGSCNYVIFSPLSLCSFDPDLLYCVADIEQGDLLMRASSYISGDLWESKSSCVIACNWMFTYPYISGKVNYLISGLEHGMARRKVYPHGRMLITIPYQKLDEITLALEQMDWKLIATREDEESKKEMKNRMDGWLEQADDFHLKSL